ncbi:MAG: hypothetical protein ACE145_20925 [Terriglobia bacterium]
MLTQDQIWQIKRRLREAEEGTTQEKVNARANYAEDVRALLGAIEEQGVGLAIQAIEELEQELGKYRTAEEQEARRRREFELAPMPRQQARITFGSFDGKMAAAGKDE